MMSTDGRFAGTVFCDVAAVENLAVTVSGGEVLTAFRIGRSMLFFASSFFLYGVASSD